MVNSMIQGYGLGLESPSSNPPARSQKEQRSAWGVGVTM